MERIQRALELARLQRTAAVDAASVAAAHALAPGQVRAAVQLGATMQEGAVARSGALAQSGAAAHLGARLGQPATASPEEPVAHTVKIDRRALHERRIVMPDDPSPAAHAYRMLRTQILRQARTHKLRMIGVVSSADGEGKTLTAVNLALSTAAEPNQTVLLVDLDLRRPSVADLLGLSVSAGLDSWFQDSDVAVSDLFVRIEDIDRLRILPALHPVPGSSEALAGSRTHELLTELKTRYTDRVVLLDLPPVLLTDDVLTIAPLLDGVLIVVSEGRTRREDVSRMRELLSSVRVLGTVLNLASESEKRTY